MDIEDVCGPFEQAHIHPEGVMEEKARAKRGSAPPRDTEPPLKRALGRARDGAEFPHSPSEIGGQALSVMIPGLADLLALVPKPRVVQDQTG